MALVIADRVRETTSSTGTGTVTLTGPFSGFQPFSVIGNGNTTYYCIIDASTGAFEVGIGTYTTSGNTLSRTTVLSSSNSGSPVSFAAGVKDVICTQPAERAVYVEGTNIVANNAATLPITTVGGLGTGVATALAVNVGTAGAPVVNGGVLGTPSSGTVTNLTGTASININGTVGATTAAAGTFTTATATTGNITTVNATTVDATNVEVTNIKAKDGTASISLADSTGIATFSKATVVSTTDNTNAALRITQLGTGNALLVEDSSNPDSSPFVIDASGKTLIARSTASTGADGALQINVQGASLPAVMSNTGSTSYRPHWMMAVNDVEVAAIGTTNTVLNTHMGGVVRTSLSSLGACTLFPTTGAGSGITVSATNLSGSTTNIGIHSSVTFGSATTVRGEGFQTTLATEAAAFTLAELGHFKATQGTIGAGSTVTNQYGFNADSTLIGATNNYGFFSELASGTGRYNFYANGTADNYFAGQVQLGAGTAAAPALSTTGDTNTGIFFPAADTIAFAEGGAEAMRIDSAGNVGIGTNSPGAKLDVNGGALIQGLTVGRGGGAISGNTTVGASALAGGSQTGTNLTALGFGTLNVNSSGNNNTAIGASVLQNNTTASDNTVVGYRAGFNNTTGASNTALGTQALQANTTASNNTAVGYQAAYSSTTATGIVAIGWSTLYNNTGVNNTAVGANVAGTFNSALYANTTGTNNAAFGTSALVQNTTGSSNTALGSQALVANTTASNNTAVGYQAGFSNTTGVNSVYLGIGAGKSVTTASDNCMAGYFAGESTTGGGNTFFGKTAGNAVTSGTKNTILGVYNGNQDSLDIRTASNYVVISDGDGTRQITMKEGQTLALDSAVPNAGTGITFPATQSASSDANTLDDYEEGTWTPNVNAGTATIKTASGTYTKIGNRVIASFVFTGDATGLISLIGGLPFTSNQSTNGAAREIQITGFLWCAQVVSSSVTFGFRRYDNDDTLTANHIYVGTAVYQV